jgi:hypothetical protein
MSEQDLFEKIFQEKLNLDLKTIQEIASRIDLVVLASDIKNNIGFLSRFTVAYPLDTTTAEQFSLLMIFFAIRQTRGYKKEDSVHSNHLREIHINLKKKRMLSPAQIDFWKWFNLQI